MVDIFFQPLDHCLDDIEHKNLDKFLLKDGFILDGYPRTVQSPTVEYFNRMREIAGIPKIPKSDFPHVPPEYLHYPVFSKYNHHEELDYFSRDNACF